MKEKDNDIREFYFIEKGTIYIVTLTVCDTTWKLINFHLHIFEHEFGVISCCWRRKHMIMLQSFIKKCVGQIEGHCITNYNSE